jgi:Ca-activated chloride channel family protein
MQFAHPYLLFVLLVLPLLARQWIGARRERLRLVYSDFRLLPLKITPPRVILAELLPLLPLAAMGLFIIALARPQLPLAPEEQSTEGIDIMLALDLSSSMLTQDFGMESRFEAAKEVLSRFVSTSHNDRLGLVVFADGAFTQCPLTLDTQVVSLLLDQVQIGMIKDGTAIGMAIATAARRLEKSDAKSKLIILLTDGINNRGRIDPLTAARAAAAVGVRIYTVGVGRVLQLQPGQQPPPDYDGIDEDALRKIAESTDGQYFRATDPTTLDAIYDGIRKMEKTRFVAKRERRVVETFPQFLWPGLALLLAYMALNATYLRKAP